LTAELDKKETTVEATERGNMCAFECSNFKDQTKNLKKKKKLI